MNFSKTPPTKSKAGAISYSGLVVSTVVLIITT